MNIEYRFLKLNDLDNLKKFCKSVKWSDEKIEWLLDSMYNNPKNFVTAAELLNNKINGIVVARPLVNLPIWLGIRVDRLLSPTSFTIFMNKTSKLLSDLFESRNYFQHYIAIKLPPTVKKYEDIPARTKKIWAQGPYQAVVERIVQSNEDFEKLPVLFQQMLGSSYSHPVVFLSMNMTYEQRIIRLKDLNERNYKDPL